jgi:hypothetical protein
MQKDINKKLSDINLKDIFCIKKPKGIDKLKLEFNSEKINF